MEMKRDEKKRAIINELYRSLLHGNEIEFQYNDKSYYILPVFNENRVTSVCFGEFNAEKEYVCKAEDELYNVKLEDSILGEEIFQIRITWKNF